MDAGYIAALSGLIGALIGSASSIATMIIQGRMKDKRDRSKQLTDMALAEFKMHLDLATSGKGPKSVLPPSTFLHHNDLVLKAIESDSYTPERAKEISLLVDQMTDVVNEIEKRRRSPGQDSGRSQGGA
jgi:hypothetical protein